ncbi:MAG: hypothetical protein PHS44_07210 [Candidatus Dojkabacteria bacterium]|jgi:hypothetical protein|nr:hypothetical protein [Candidatus Dojkabacteria bacterium]
MKKFLKKNWTLLIVIIYFIFPDLIPGGCDDIVLLFVERILNNAWHQFKIRKSVSTPNDEKA